MGFPETRMRRLRSSDAMRRLVRRVKLDVDDFVYPLFVCPGEGIKEPIASMSGCYHFSADLIAGEARSIGALGIPAVLLFGLPEKKDPLGSEALAENSTVCNAVRQIKKACPGMLVITDVCLCAYTDHGHCGIIEDGRINNDASCRQLAKMALAHAQAGADIIAPSDMMDGRISYIREILDNNEFCETAIMSYAAKYASAFYGPFRDAAHSAPGFGDRKSYQMDPADSGQAVREIQLDIDEGADIAMVKPALPYLDIIYQARRKFDLPIAAYNVSGEYMMITAAAQAGLVDGEDCMMESLVAIKRAGADIIITYFAKKAAELLK